MEEMKKEWKKPHKDFAEVLRYGASTVLAYREETVSLGNGLMLMQLQMIALVNPMEEE